MGLNLPVGFLGGTVRGLRWAATAHASVDRSREPSPGRAVQRPFSAYLSITPAQRVLLAAPETNLLGIVEFTKSSAVERFSRCAWPSMPDYFGSGTSFAAARWIAANFDSFHPNPKTHSCVAERHLDSPHREVRNLASALFEHHERLFTFLDRRR